MRTLSFITTTVFATILIAGCGSKQAARTRTPAQASSPRATHKPASAVAKTQRARGEIREALLHLRRVHFGFDTATLLPEARTALEEAARRLQTHPNVHIYIDGHTDERGTTEYNLALGERRARAVSDYLMRLGIPAERLHIMTFGKEQPFAAGRSELAYAKNRRADFRLMRGDVRLTIDEGVLYNDRGQKLAAANF